MSNNPMKETVFDPFATTDGWQGFASGEAKIQLSVEGGSLRLDFDFHGGGGFVVARKEFVRNLPPDYAFSFRVRGKAPKNKLEFKLADRTNRNVWRWQEDAFDFRDTPRELHLHGSSIDFAWGPAGGGHLRKLGAVEFVMSAGPGGKGTVWIDRFHFQDRTNRKKPRVTVSSAAKGCEDPSGLLDAKGKCDWHGDPHDKRPWISIDFHQAREYGGLIIDWLPRPARRSFAVQASDDALQWRTIQKIGDARGARSFVHLPITTSRYLRLAFDVPPPGVKRLAVQSYTFSKTLIDTFHSIASLSQRGYYPRYLLREQSYWTCAGTPDGHTCALINEEGMVEPDKGSFSLEPFLHSDDGLLTWDDARRSVGMEPGGLPIPSVHWTLPGLKLQVTAFATGSGAESVLFVRYRVTNTSPERRRVKLYVALRPFQVNPPWQEWGALGGVSKINTIKRSAEAVWVNGDKAVIPLAKPSSFGCASFEQGTVSEHLAAGTLPDQDKVTDEFGFASAALGFAMRIAPDASRDIFVAVPFGRKTSKPWAREVGQMNGRIQLADAIRALRSRLDSVEFQMHGSAARDAARSFKTAAGQILINRDGPALQPGPRRYTRSWVRDGVIMGAALLRTGDPALVDFLRWYAPFQRPSGFVPCCVDRNGPDWLVEHDSHGQLIYGVRECFRFSGDVDFLRDFWPYVRKAARFIERLRARRMTAEYQAPDKRDRYGLLPESASHEGYLAHPVHSYWDDFWALRGLLDAAAIASALGKRKDAADFEILAASLRETLRTSMLTVIMERKLNYVPGSVEWADFDPTATSNAISLLQCADDFPPKPLAATFDLFVRDFRRKHSGEMDWNNYTAYEIRIVGALVRLGMRDEAVELLETFLEDQRPQRWDQWPEITWRDLRSPGHLGDVPHTWISAEYMLAFASLFAWERESDDSLVIGSGIPLDWLSSPRGLAVKGLRTWHGKLDLSMKLNGDLLIALGGEVRVPAGGFVLRPPCPGAIKSVVVNGRRVDSHTTDEVTIHEAPAEVLIRFSKSANGTQSLRSS